MKTTDYIKTFFLVAIVLIFALPRGSGFLFPLLLLFFVATTLYRLVQSVRRAEGRKKHFIRIGIWAATLALVGAMQIYWSTASRNNAEIIAQEILAYQRRTGSFPSTLNEIGIDEQELKDKWKIRYFKGQGMLTYPSSFMPLTLYEYDFQAHRWVVNTY